MNIKQRRERVLEVLNLRNRFQFRQPKSNKTAFGKFACTDACIQLIVKIAKDRNVSLNEVRRRSKAPSNRGMRASEAKRALRRFGLDYDIYYGLDVDQVIKMIRNRGPVIIAEMYWAHPQWRGYNYAGRKQNGKAVNNNGKTVRVGFAKGRRGGKKAGATQWTFRGGHAVLAATILPDGSPAVRDPNHNSPVRPERPAYDDINRAQLARMMKSWPYGYTYVLAPKSKVVN